MIARVSIGDVWFAVISSGRPTAPQTLRSVVGSALDSATWYVGLDEGEAYVEHGARQYMEVDGLCAARNVALEDAALFGLPCLQLSDDLRRIVVAKNREDWTPEVPRYVRDSDVTFDQLVADMLLQMNTYNVSLVGVAPTDSLLGYPGDNMPPRQRSFILGDCMLIRPTPLRFDTNLQLKEDYDFTAQHLARYGKVLRLDNWLLSFEHRTNAGGACDRRNPLTENAAVTYLQAKWGRDVFVRRLPPKHLEVAFRWPQNGIVPADSDGVVAARRV